MSHVTNVTICIGMSRCRYNGTTQSRNNEKGNYGTLRLKLWQFPIESASNADSGNVILWERERQTLVAFTAFSVF